MLQAEIRCLWLVFCLFFVLLTACGGGGGGTPAPALPDLQVSVMSHSFGTVTLFNSPAAKVVTLSNRGKAQLDISNIELTGAGFALDLDGGVGFCGSATPTINAGESCAVAVAFEPTSEIDYSGTLSVSSNDPDTATVDILFDGTGQVITLPVLHINQVEADACASSELTVYLSVTDQKGYSISGLPLSSFTLTETFNGATLPVTIGSLDFANNISTSVSVALVMDYSQSISDNPAVLAGMEDGVVSFINQLGPTDAAEIVKFDSEVEVVQPFIAGDAAGRALLIEKVKQPWDHGIYTRLYEALYQAVSDTASRLDDRRAVILLTDGGEYVGPDGPPPSRTFIEVKDYAVATGVPIFAIGIGADVDQPGLELLTSETGGQFFDAQVADDLYTIYQQLAEILYVDQYVLTYDTVFNPGDSAMVTVGVQLGGPVVYDSRDVLPCP